VRVWEGFVHGEFFGEEEIIALVLTWRFVGEQGFGLEGWEAMGVAVGSEDEMDDMPISNPLPPPPRPQGKNGRRESAEAAAARAENLSNADFRKMVMDTPRRGEEKPKERPRGLASSHQQYHITSSSALNALII
jgi:hypothetical protein